MTKASVYVEWLEAESHRTAKELFDRLRREHPGMFLPGPLRDTLLGLEEAGRRRLALPAVGTGGGELAWTD